MASSMHAQVLEYLSILDEALLQPHNFIGLDMAVGGEIPGFGHDTTVSELTDENRASSPPHVPFPGPRFDARIPCLTGLTLRV